MSKSAKDKNDLAAFMSGVGDEENEPHHLESVEVSPAVPRKRIKKEKPKIGRRTFKQPGVKYVRFTVDLPEDTKELVDLARVKSGAHKGKHQAVIVDEALRAYLKKG